MLSKEEIAKAKERISKSLNDVLFATLYSQEENEEDEKILLAYIKQLETKLENVFWEGYITKQNEAVEICKICKYKNKVEQLETNKQKIIEKLEERIQSVEKCYQDLIKPYYDEKLNLINTSIMSKKEKEEFINKRNCLLVQKHCYKEILEIMKGEKE